MTLELEPVINTLSAFAATSYEYAQTAASWGGHLISEGYTRVAVPVAEKVAEFAIYAFEIFKQALESGPGPVFAMAGGLLLVGITAFKMADLKAYEQDNLAKSLWQTVGVVSFIGATALGVFGVTTILSV